MHVALTWSEISLRLFSAFAAGALIGLNRSDHGRAAGLPDLMRIAWTPQARWSRGYKDAGSSTGPV